MRVFIKPLEYKLGDTIISTVTFIDLGLINVEPDGSSGKVGYELGTINSNVDFTKEEVQNFNSLSFENGELVDYILLKLKLERL